MCKSLLTGHKGNTFDILESQLQTVKAETVPEENVAEAFLISTGRGIVKGIRGIESLFNIATGADTDALTSLLNIPSREEEAAAFGAALQALWALKTSEEGPTDLAAITDEHIQLNKNETVEPDPETVKVYEKAYDEYKQYLKLLKPKFL